MSCNGCRVLRKGCSENCILRPCLQWIESPEAQGFATVFVAKFFGRAGLMSFISAVPDNQRPALFQSLLFEAAGRTVNPVTGAVGLLWTGNWHVYQAAVETVLRGGTLQTMPEFLGGGSSHDFDEASNCTTTDMFKLRQYPLPSTCNMRLSSGRSTPKRRRRIIPDEQQLPKVRQLADLDLTLTPGFHGKLCNDDGLFEKRRLGSPSLTSEESDTTITTCFESDQYGEQPKLLKLLN